MSESGPEIQVQVAQAVATIEIEPVQTVDGGTVIDTAEEAALTVGNDTLDQVKSLEEAKDIDAAEVHVGNEGQHDIRSPSPDNLQARVSGFESTGSEDVETSPEAEPESHNAEEIDPIRVEEDFARPDTSVELVASRVQVAVRMRPLQEFESENGLLPVGKRLQVQNRKIQAYVESKQKYKLFNFDHVFSERDDQASVFEKGKLRHYVRQVVDGFHSTVFAYG